MFVPEFFQHQCIDKADFGLREAKVRGTLILAGEETPEDNAMLSRSIVVSVTDRTRVENHYNWFMKNRLKFSYHILDILRRKKGLLPRFIEILDEAKDHFVENGTDDRTAINLAIVAAGYAVSFGDQDIDFADWLTGRAKQAMAENEEEQAVSIFKDYLMAMKTRGLINDHYWTVEDGRIYLYFHGLYEIYAKEYRQARGVEPFKAASIRDYLKEDPGFVSMNHLKRIKGDVKKCIVFDEEKCCEEFRCLTENFPVSLV
jgi:hypothetical protein